jgi:hypothetical protein
MLQAAAETFSVTCRPGSEGQNMVRAKVGRVYMPIESTVFLFQERSRRVCVITSHFMTHYASMSNLLRKEASRILGIGTDRVLSFSSHNHSDSLLSRKPLELAEENPTAILPRGALSREGAEFLEKLRNALRRLPKRLVQVRTAWAVGHETRISHNRKGRRSDGSTYFMREEDRVLLGADFSGAIDSDAPVLAFLDAESDPVCFLVQFTGHPVTCYHPEKPVVHGDYPQIACAALSRKFGGVPVGFLQGCCGDINSKGLLAAKPARVKVADAERFGRFLGATYTEAAGKLTLSARDGIDCRWIDVKLPFQNVPSAASLRRDLAEIDDFLSRCDAGDPDTLTCVGLNMSRTMSPRYRAALLRPVKRWAEWALRFREEHRLQEAPTHADLPVAALRIGDVGILGMPCEPFSGIGLRLKRDGRLPLVIPCGYMNDASVAYVPDGPNNGDREYISSYYRYTTRMLPFRKPAGDRLAAEGARLLSSMARSEAGNGKKR